MFSNYIEKISIIFEHFDPLSIIIFDFMISSFIDFIYIEILLFVLKLNALS